MPFTRSEDFVWLRTRVRILCGLIFLLSLFAPAYTPEAENVEEHEFELDTQDLLVTEEGFLMKTSSLTEQGDRSAFSEGIIHTVEKGENVRSIAQISGISADTIRWANNLEPGTSVQIGQKLLILPVDGVLHEVKRGQNLQTIAELYGINAETIAKQNKLKGGYLLAGQSLIVPGGKPIVEKKKSTSVAITLPAKSTSTPTKNIAAPNYSIAPTYGILQMPCDCYYTQNFSSTHFGIDLQHKGGSPIFAAEAGTVIRSEKGWNGGYGNVIEIDHGNGLVTLYAHNKTLYVQKGDRVARGAPIAFMGNTGRVHGPTGIHLHFEVRVNGVKKSPNIYLEQ